MIALYSIKSQDARAWGDPIPSRDPTSLASRLCLQHGSRDEALVLQTSGHPSEKKKTLTVAPADVMNYTPREIIIMNHDLSKFTRAKVPNKEFSKPPKCLKLDSSRLSSPPLA